MKKNTILSLLVLCIIILFVIDPEKNMASFLGGIKVWAIYILPALFPFFIFTKLLSSLKVVDKLSKKLSPITGFLFNSPGISAYIYVMSILSGYPVGAKLTADLYMNKIISKEEAIKMTTFTSTSGPLFIIGTVGIGMFCNFTFGLVILISHILGAILNGIIFRGRKTHQSIQLANYPTTPDILEDTMWSSIKSILMIGGYVSIFFVIIGMLNNYNLLLPINKLLNLFLAPLGFPSGVSSSITSGFFEVTNGCLSLSQTTLNLSISAIITTFLISFGGLCIHLQAMSFLKKFDMSTKFYFFMKFCQAIISSIICIPFAILML